VDDYFRQILLPPFMTHSGVGYWTVLKDTPSWGAGVGFQEVCAALWPSRPHERPLTDARSFPRGGSLHPASLLSRESGHRKTGLSEAEGPVQASRKR
jgi:hypothetical protein